MGLQNRLPNKEKKKQNDWLLQGMWENESRMVDWLCLYLLRLCIMGCFFQRIILQYSRSSIMLQYALG